MKPVRLVPLSRATRTRDQSHLRDPDVQLVPEEVLDNLVGSIKPEELPSDTASRQRTSTRPESIDLTDVGRQPAHQLVVLGDSIGQGFRNFAVSDTSWSWPSIVARCAGIPNFRKPDYDLPAECPGIPFNVDRALREVFQQQTAGVIDLRSPFELRSLMDQVEDCWERGAGAALVDRSLRDPSGHPNHNLAFYGADLRDALSLTHEKLTDIIGRGSRRRDNFLRQIPSASAARSAAIALAGGADAGGDSSMVGQLEKLSRDGGVGTVVLALGGNNALSSVLSLNLEWSRDDSYRDLEKKEAATVWQPHHFRAEYDELAARVAACGPRRVIVMTVPHVTIIPALRGHGRRAGSSRYFDYYTHPWVPTLAFNPRRDRYLTRKHVRVIDQTIALYNQHIVTTAKSYGWAVFDLAAMLDRLAYRRFVEHPIARPDWWSPYQLPPEYAQLDVPPDSRFLSVRDGQRVEGGLFGLDGVHPTICASALVAHEVLLLMKHLGAVVAEERPDFAAALAADQTVMSPPPRVDLAFDVARGASRLANLWSQVRRIVRL